MNKNPVFAPLVVLCGECGWMLPQDKTIQPDPFPHVGVVCKNSACSGFNKRLYIKLAAPEIYTPPEFDEEATGP